MNCGIEIRWRSAEGTDGIDTLCATCLEEHRWCYEESAVSAEFIRPDTPGLTWERAACSYCGELVFEGAPEEPVWCAGFRRYNCSESRDPRDFDEDGFCEACAEREEGMEERELWAIGART